MQLAININNESIANKVLWMLEHFKSDGVEVVELNSADEKDILDNFQEGLREIKSINAGTLKSKPAQELLNDL